MKNVFGSKWILKGTFAQNADQGQYTVDYPLSHGGLNLNFDSYPGATKVHFDIFETSSAAIEAFYGTILLALEHRGLCWIHWGLPVFHINGLRVVHPKKSSYKTSSYQTSFTKLPFTKCPITERPSYKTSRLPNVHFTKPSGYRMSSLQNI